MPKRLLITVCVLVVAISLQAGFKNVELLYGSNFNQIGGLTGWTGGAEKHWRPHAGPNGNGALLFRTMNATQTDWVTLRLAPKKFSGLIQLEATVKGRNIEPGEQSYCGPKVMLHYVAGNKQEYPEPDHTLGTYGWKKISMIRNMPGDLSSLDLIVGLQGAKGEFWVGNVKIWRCVETADSAEPPPGYVNTEARKIPHGDFKGGKYRGFMSGDDLSPAAFDQLTAWHANLLRFQMHPEKYDISTPEKYLAGLDKEIVRADEALKLAAPRHIKLVLDLHCGPGTTINKVASNILGEGTDVPTLEEAWKKLATHFKGNPNIYGYDLLNEPINNNGRIKTCTWRLIAERLVKAVRAIDPAVPLIVEPGSSISDLTGMTPLPDKHIIYSPHFYEPFAYTHQGVHEVGIKWSYPGMIDGVYWDKEQLRVSMKSAIEFQQKYHVPIFVGEFSVVNWAKGGDRYLADQIALFEEYGWDWTYHAFREWNAWSIEHQGLKRLDVMPSADNPRKQAVLSGLRHNLQR